MKAFFCLVFILGILFSISACDSAVNQNGISSLKYPEIVYLQPTTNLTSQHIARDGADCSRYGVLPLYRPNGEIIDALIARESSLFTERADAIRALGFDEQMHDVFASVIAADTMTTTKEIKVIQCSTLDEDDYSRKSNADSVIYLRPSFLLSNDKTEFEVDVLVEIQKYDVKDVNRVVHNLGKHEFSFTHKIDLKKPGMTWDEQKAAAHAQASMSWEQDMDYWFGNDSIVLRTDYSQDLRQIDLGLREFFGVDTKSPGGSADR